MKTNVAIITAKFNHEITSQLAASCENELQLHGATVSHFTCPGAVELPQIALRLINNKNFDAIVLIGAIIKGDTDHYEYVSQLVVNATAGVITRSEIPIIFGVLTTQSEELAEERANPAKMNKGKEFALAAIESIAEFRKCNLQKAL